MPDKERHVTQQFDCDDSAVSSGVVGDPIDLSSATKAVAMFAYKGAVAVKIQASPLASSLSNGWGKTIADADWYDYKSVTYNFELPDPGGSALGYVAVPLFGDSNTGSDIHATKTEAPAPRRVRAYVVSATGGGGDDPGVTYFEIDATREIA